MFNKKVKQPTMSDVLEVYKTQALVCDEIAEREAAKIAVFKLQLEASEKEQKLAKNFCWSITSFLEKLEQ